MVETTGTPGLGALLEPVSRDDFFSKHWEIAPLHVKGRAPDRYREILTQADLETLIETGDLRYPALQLARGGSYFAAEAYTGNVKHGTETFMGVPDVEKVLAEYRSGATVVLPAIHRRWQPLRRLCRAIEEETDHAVHANAYLTPGRAQGFVPHYDTHEVFVLQLAGTKRWRVYEPPIALPHRSQKFNPQGYAPGAPLLELELAEGDLLYLPRGYVHTASTAEEASAHVTIGVTVYTWIELISDALESLKGSRELRRALPPGFLGQAARGALVTELRAELGRIAGVVPADQAVDVFLQRVRAARLRKDPSFDASAVVVGEATRLRIVPEDDTVEVLAHHLVLAWGDRKLSLPLGVRTTLEAVRERGRFVVGELPPDLDAGAKLAFVRFLEAEGFLVQA